MARAPLLVPAVSLVLGVLAEAHGLALWAVLAIFGTFAHRRTALGGAFLLAGVALATWRGHPAMIEGESHVGRYAGTVVGDVRRGDDAAEFRFALAGGPVVTAHLRGGAPAAGARLILRGRIAPFDVARNPGEPSPRALARGEGLAGELMAMRVIAAAPPDPRDVRTWGPRARAWLSARLRAVVREPEATVVAGALWGERGTLPRDLRADFQATGTVHVLVTAGLHLGVIAAVVLGALRLARIPRIAASLAAIPCVLAYAWLSGAHLPSQRAAVMVSIALLARACGARPVSWNAMALAAIVITVLWPASVTTVSFALSFSCVAAIALFANRLDHAIERLGLPHRVREALALTIATQIGVWPLSAATFGVLAPYAVLANAIVVPATGVAMIAGIATLIAAGIPPAARFAATLATWDVDAMLRTVTAVASLPGARVWVAPPPAFVIVLYDLAALGAAVLLHRRPRVSAVVLAAASLIVLLATLRLPDGKLHITVLDVGQGDGIVVRTPRGHVVLIDSGGRLERGRAADGRSPAEMVGERVVLGYLEREGIRHVDLLLNTHPHGDHVGGCRPIVEALRVDAIGDSGQEYGGRAFRDCLAAARERRVPVVLVRKGMHYATGDGVSFDALGPEEPLLAEGRNDVNENSIVLRAAYRCATCARPFRMLFTGDAGAETEARILAAGTELAADVLKVGHHGSAYSSTPAFIAAVHPRFALISVGRHNLFGHPAPTTLSTIRGVGATAYRTDLCGSITVEAETSVRIATTLDC